jgi:hypothetical protein
MMPPYPFSPAFTQVTWAPVSSIQRFAEGLDGDGSDNWPLTWADDDHLYAAYGDGYGFRPMTPTKLGLGFAQIRGSPATQIVGTNIRSPAENPAMGPAGAKASGLLMIDRVLYLWLRNTDGHGRSSRLAWSTDYAHTWTLADWTFPSLGYPTFINYGRNYAGARDQYVYIVSHDHPSAYHAADQFVLLRAPRTHLRFRRSYEFLARYESDGRPQWTADIKQRGAVFTFPGHCCRSGITYNAPLGRYLWWQQHTFTHQELHFGDPAIDTRYHGGFGIYDAPEPWGPWTTTYFTECWDVGPGEAACFPTKWISPDGRSLYLVFSGNDAFSIRQVTLHLQEPDRWT